MTMTASLGIRPTAVPAWLELRRALDSLTEPTACRSDPELWWDPPAEVTDYVLGLCCRCPVLAQCEAFATTNNERAGIWAGRDRTRRPGRPAQPKEKTA